MPEKITAKGLKGEAQAFTFTEHENVAAYDWRLAVATTLAESARLPSGRRAEANSVVVAVCPVRFDYRTLIRYNMPDVCALLLDAANKAWSDCANITSAFTKKGPDGYQSPENDSDLMMIIEKRMMIVVFSYTALEAFANEFIAEAYTKGQYVYSVPNPKTKKTFTLEEIERHMDLDTKLCQVLPEIAGVKTPKGPSTGNSSPS